MSTATYAFVFNGSDLSDWKFSDPDDWDLDIIDLEGTEKVLGHHRIDGSICKVVRTTDGKLVAISKSNA